MLQKSYCLSERSDEAIHLRRAEGVVQSGMAPASDAPWWLQLCQQPTPMLRS